MDTDRIARAPAPIRLLVVDGHPITRWALTRMADDEPDLMALGGAGTAAEALQLVSALKPDVITIDISLPDRDGLELARELRDRFALLGIVIFTDRGEDDELFRALETGASAFVAKTASTPEILAAVRHAAVSASSFSSRGLADALQRRKVSLGGALSERELQVLRLLLAGHSIPIIAADLYISPSTAKTYVARLYEKLGAHNRAQALMSAIRLGLVEATERERRAVS